MKLQTLVGLKPSVDVNSRKLGDEDNRYLYRCKRVDAMVEAKDKKRSMRWSQ